MKKLVSALLVAVMLLSVTTPVMAYTPPVEDPTVYTSVEALYSAARSVYREHKSGDYVFNMTDEVWGQITRYDELYHQSFFTGDIFDFNGDQNTIPATDGDYLYHNYGGFRGDSVNDYSKTLTISAGSGYFTTLEQEASFESALAALFAAGGPLAHLKTATDYEKVAGCLNYISHNVSYIGTTDGKYHSAYSALCGEKKATCQGYALLFYRMLRELGIPNRILMVTSTGAHTFNVVLLDGKYYYCDATSNMVLKGTNSFNPGQLQEQFQTDEFKANILSRLSTTDYPAPHTHSYASSYSSDASSHWKACACGEVSGKEAHTAGDWVIVKEASVSTEGEKAKSCTVCGYKLETQKIDKLPSKEYAILDGGKETTYATKGEELAIRAEGDIKKFVSVYVDGKEVDKKHYTVKEGSTIIIFTEEFLSSLKAGKHEVTFNFTDGVAKANLTVAESAVKPDNTPKPSESEGDKPTDKPDGQPNEGSESSEKPDTEADTTVTEEETESTEEPSTSPDNQPSPTPDKDSDTEGGSSLVWWILGILLLAAAGGGAYYYFAIIKKRTQV